MRRGKQPDYRNMLIQHIGPASVKAIRALDAGVDPLVVWLQYQEDMLPPMLAQALAAARQTGFVTTDDLRALDKDASPSTLSNRLTALEHRGLLSRLSKPEKVKGGGRRFVYVAWDGSETRGAESVERSRVPRPVPDSYEVGWAN